MPAPGTNIDKYIACATIVPDCPFEATATSEEELLQMVAAHAAHDHGVTAITPELAETIRRINPAEGLIVPFVTDEMEYLSADVEDRFVIAQANTPLNEESHFVRRRVSCRASWRAVSFPAWPIDRNARMASVSASGVASAGARTTGAPPRNCDRSQPRGSLVFARSPTRAPRPNPFRARSEGSMLTD